MNTEDPAKSLFPHLLLGAAYDWLYAAGHWHPTHSSMQHAILTFFRYKFVIERWEYHLVAVHLGLRKLICIFEPRMMSQCYNSP